MRPKLTQREIEQRIAMGDKLRAMRSARGWSQEYVAERVGIGHRAIQQLEHGIVFPTVQRAVRLARVYEVSIDALIGEFD